MTTRRLARAATAVAVFTTISRLLGLGREIVMAASYGATAATDSFVNALLLVNLVAAVVLYAVVTVVIPVFSAERERTNEQSAWQLVWAYSAWVALALIAVTAFIAIFPQLPTALFHLDPTRAAITARLVRIMAPALLLQGIAALLTALLQIHNKFAFPAAVGIAFNVGIIVGVVVGRGSIGINAAAWGVTIGALMQVLLQTPQLLRLRRGVQLRPVLTHPGLTAVLITSIPVALASVLQQINTFTDKLFASSLEAGRVTALQYANSLGAAPRAALLMPVLMPLFPFVAKLIAEGRDEEAVRGIDRINGLLALTAIPAGFLIALYATETTQLLLGRGHCGEVCVHQTATPLAWYALATLGAFLTMFLNRALAAANLQREILVATVTAVVVTIALDLILLRPLAQGGIALASLIGIYLNVAMYLWYLRRRFPSYNLMGLVRQQGRIILCGLICVVVALAANQIWPTGGLKSLTLVAPLLIKVALALVAYVIAARFLARPEFNDVVRVTRALFHRQRPSINVS
jgi:putative peptidoglycan lipid II flippase